MEIIVGYRDLADEIIIASKDHSRELDSINQVISKEDLLKYQALVDDVPVPESVMSMAVSMVRRTRLDDPISSPQVHELLEWGAGQRAAYYLVNAARAYSLLYGEGVCCRKKHKIGIR